MTQNGYVWELTMSVRPTSGNGSGYWPTPNAEGETGYMSGSNRDTWRPTLVGAVQISPDGPPPLITADEYRGKGRKAALWPTPNVPNGGRTAWHAEQEGNSFYHQGKKVQLGLEQAVRMWPTPRSVEWKNNPYQRKGPYQWDTLSGAVQHFPTPTANSKDDWTTVEQQRLSGQQRKVMQARGEALPHGQGQLNPTWVCWLMGWPLDWEAAGPLNRWTFLAWLLEFRSALNA
jgi:hypothetical protein